MREDTLNGVATVEAARHDSEWLLDEALEETFPASDPVAAVQPGSSVAVWGRAPAKRESTREVA